MRKQPTYLLESISGWNFLIHVFFIKTSILEIQNMITISAVWRKHNVWKLENDSKLIHEKYIKGVEKCNKPCIICGPHLWTDISRANTRNKSTWTSSILRENLLCERQTNMGRQKKDTCITISEKSVICVENFSIICLNHQNFWTLQSGIFEQVCITQANLRSHVYINVWNCTKNDIKCLNRSKLHTKNSNLIIV